MSIEYCESCDTYIDTDEDVEGVYLTTAAVLYGDSPEPSYTTFSCSNCQDELRDEYESREAHEEQIGQDKRRGY